MTTNEQKFSILMGYLSMAFEKGEMRKERMELYWRHLKDIDLYQLEKAVARIIRERKYSSIPQIAELREIALGIDEDRLEIMALDALAKANALVVTGLWGACIDENLKEAIRLTFGSWDGFGNARPDNPMDDHRFVDNYKLAMRAKMRPERLIEAGQIKGELDDKNGRTG